MAAFVSLYGLFADVGTAQKHLALLAGVLPADSLTFIGGEMIRIAATKKARVSKRHLHACRLIAVDLERQRRGQGALRRGFRTSPTRSGRSAASSS